MSVLLAVPSSTGACGGTSVGSCGTIGTDFKMKGMYLYKVTKVLRVLLVKFLGSRGLTLGLLITGVLYFLWLSALWLLNQRPAAVMLWAPLSALSIPFLANLTVSLFKRRYVYVGNILFHAAFLIIFIGLRLSMLTRFDGAFVLTEGEIFFGGEEEYSHYTAKGGFDETAPDLSLRLDGVIPEFWNERLHFTRLDGEVRYPATTLKNKALISLNGGLRMDGARLRLKGFGYAPEVRLEGSNDSQLRRVAPRMALFPPGAEDHLDIGSYRVYVKVLSDPYLDGGKLKNRSMNLVDPLFLVRVRWLDRTIYVGTLKANEPVSFGSFRVTFGGIKYWAAFGVVKDRGEGVVFVGLAALVLGLVLRLVSSGEGSDGRP